MDEIRIFSIIFAFVFIGLAIQTGRLLRRRGYHFPKIYGYVGGVAGALLIAGTIYTREQLGLLPKYGVLTAIFVGAIIMLVSIIIIFMNEDSKGNDSNKS